ncbi:MAG: Aminodeoxychorismate synthase [Chitinophagaceae bacterium]|nr:Aminodeoxychorismate synthase [Chitinophagaceae bacterium]
MQETFTITDIQVFKKQMLNWLNLFNICCFMDSHEYTDVHGSYNCLAAAGCKQQVAITDLKNNSSWLFGHCNYEAGYSFLGIDHIVKPTTDPFPQSFFFQPEHVIILKGQQVIIESETLEPAAIFEAIKAGEIKATGYGAIQIQSRISKQEYIENVKHILAHIHRGDCYELNYCQEFFAKNVMISPVDIYLDLCRLSPAPFAVFYKVNNAFLISASPERFLRKQEREIYSQPIKGTIGRDVNSEIADEKLKQQLYNSDKERSENVMVVDMVRNDLSKICEEGTVTVKELYGIYTFPQVHQMISTIKGNLKGGVQFDDILKATFPMGSMTGAPKKRVVELIRQYEPTERGIYSGTVGYISPGGDFDFNVIIRSIIYDEKNKCIRYAAGGGITFNSDPEKEYEESLLKASAIKKVLENSST